MQSAFQAVVACYAMFLNLSCALDVTRQQQLTFYCMGNRLLGLQIFFYFTCTLRITEQKLNSPSRLEKKSTWQEKRRATHCGWIYTEDAKHCRWICSEDAKHCGWICGEGATHCVRMFEARFWLLRCVSNKMGARVLFERSPLIEEAWDTKLTT